MFSASFRDLITFTKNIIRDFPNSHNTYSNVRDFPKSHNTYANVLREFSKSHNTYSHCLRDLRRNTEHVLALIVDHVRNFTECCELCDSRLELASEKFQLYWPDSHKVKFPHR
jgi:uncharacterized protein YciW